MSATVDAFLDEYIRRYTAGDVRGVTNLCHVPFLAVRRGEAIHMPDSGAVWDHFAAAIDAYRRASGVETWNRLETDTRQLGEHSVFASVHWNALDANGKVVRDTWTSYQLLGPGGVAIALVHESLLAAQRCCGRRGGGGCGYGAMVSRVMCWPAMVKSHLRSAVPPGKLPVRRPVTR